MRKFYTFTFLFTLALINFHCRYSLEVYYKFDKKGGIIFIIKSNSPFSNDKVNNIRVTNLQNNEVMWSIWADDPIIIDKFIYGKVPAGFKEYGSAKKLILNSKYKVYVSGLGISGSNELKYIY